MTNNTPNRPATPDLEFKELAAKSDTIFARVKELLSSKKDSDIAELRELHQDLKHISDQMGRTLHSRPSQGSSNYA